MKYLTRILMVLLIFTAAQACTELLEEPQPSTDISEVQALTNEGTVNALRHGMYTELHSFNYTTEYMIGPSALADDSHNRQDATRFIGLNQNNQGSGLSSWGSAYDLINKANLIIHAIEEGVLSEAQQRQYEGEAFVLRAFAMHHLVRALAYEPQMWPEGPVVGDIPVTHQASNGWNHGIIVRTEPVRSVTDADFRPRRSVSEVYDQMRSDLNAAIQRLSQGDAGNPTFVTEAAAHALLARIELYDRNYQAAEDAASAALANTSASLATPGQVPTMFDETAGLNPEGIFVTHVANSSESTGVNNSLASYTSQTFTAQVPTQSLMDLYSADDARLSWYVPCEAPAETGCRATHPDITGGTGFVKTIKWNAEPGSYIDDIPLFRVAEMKLIQAEARLNGATGVPLTPLNELRQNRNLAPLATVSMDDILEERRREFAYEGHRFWDLKRLGMTIVKDPAIAAQFGAVEDVPYGDFRVLDDLPNSEVVLSQENAEEENWLLQNPGHE